MFTAEGQRNIIIVLMLIVIGVLLFPERIRKAVLVVATEDGKEAAETSTSRAAPEPTIVKRENLASASA